MLASANSSLKAGLKLTLDMALIEQNKFTMFDSILELVNNLDVPD